MQDSAQEKFVPELLGDEVSTHSPDACLRYWRNIEFFLPFNLDSVYKNSRNALSFHLNSYKEFPWEELSLLRKLEEDSEEVETDDFKALLESKNLVYDFDLSKEYLFDVYIFPFKISSVLKVLSEKLKGVSPWSFSNPEDAETLSCLARLTVNESGHILWQDSKVSTLPWALESFVSGQKISCADFDLYANEFFRDFMEESSEKINLKEESVDETKYNYCSIKRASLKIAEKYQLKFFPQSLFAVSNHYRFKRKKRESLEKGEEAENKSLFLSPDFLVKKARKKRKVDILNSFYLRDLELTSSYLKELDSRTPLKSYLKPQKDFLNNRVDVLLEKNKEEAIKKLRPKHQNLGRWPNPKEQHLSFQQQLAINNYISGSCSLQSVNGPPGTGKTTLVREILAHLVVERAKALSSLKTPGEAFSEKEVYLTLGSREVRFRKLIPQLKGHELVIVSNNNAAAKNISLEVIKQSSISKEFDEAGYLSPVSELYQEAILGARRRNSKNVPIKSKEDTQTWGLLAAALGNSANRNLFKNSAFYFNDKDDKAKEKRLREGRKLSLFEFRKNYQKGRLSFQQARKRFLEKLLDYQKQIEGFDELSPACLNFPVLSKEYQLNAPFSSAKLNSLRSELFISALKLQEAWVREAPNLEKELRALSALLMSPREEASEQIRELWALLFMITPAISSTLASVETMFSGLPPGSIANLVIEEGGQATPQSTVGSLMRAKKALIIGDQRQLEPVVTTPKELEKRLMELSLAEAKAQKAKPGFLDSKSISISILPGYSVLSGSSLSVADLQSALGTYLNSPNLEKTWISNPLLVHRRCQEPMFSISNSLAYDQIMIQAGDFSNLKAPALGPSSWHQVEGSVKEGHWVPEQGEELKVLLEKLFKENLEKPGQIISQRISSNFPDFFIISPFRAVRAELKKLYKRSFVKSLGVQSLEIPYVISELKKRTGTVHTFQGKEAEIVFLVLGCDQSKAAAANWAGSKLSLVNVAVTRAKHYLYVIGDINLWHNKGYFSDLEKSLEKRGV